MRRLTISKYSTDHAQLKEGIGHNPPQMLIDRLAEYEDTGRDPSEIANLDYDVAMLKQSARTANELFQLVTHLRSELKKETALRRFFERAAGQINGNPD